MTNYSLKKFFELTKTDPLFAAEGMDCGNAEQALGALERATRELETVWRPAARWFCFWYPFVQTLHPFGFLREFIRSERVRRSFLANPSKKSARDLTAQYRRTHRALAQDGEGYREALLAIQRKEKFPDNAGIQYFDNTITFTQVLEMASSIQKNAAAILHEIETREALLEGVASENPVASTPLPRPDPIPFLSSGPELTPLLKELLESQLSKADAEEVYGPIYYKTSLFDKVPTAHCFYAYITRAGKNTPPELRIRLADQYYFLDLDEMKDKFFLGMSIYEPLIRRGIRYWNQPATTWYSVFDSRYHTDLATIVDLAWRRPFLDRAAVENQKSSLFDLLLQTGVSHETGYTTLSKVMRRARELPSFIFTYVARGYPSMYYLPFNRSVWRIPWKTEFAGTRFSADTHYKTLREIVPSLTKEELREVLRGGYYRRTDWKNLL